VTAKVKSKSAKRVVADKTKIDTRNKMEKSE
jgi:hypothetical protein